jgi:threonine dehydratase
LRGAFHPRFRRRGTVDGPDDPLLWRARSAPVLQCRGCGAVAGTGDPWPWACPRRGDADEDDVDHVIVPQLDLAGVPLVMSASANPFVRYRGRLLAYHLWIGAGRDDQSFVALVEALDGAVAQVAGHGFRVTPLTFFPTLDEAVGTRVLVKDETANVAGSHKGRHLFGVLLLLRVLELLGHDVPGGLVIASCGNAAVAAAVMARAGGRHLTAFVPPDAPASVRERLAGLGAAVMACPRDGRPGDPCHRRLRQAVAGGAIAFTCQGPDNGFAIEGASAIAWEVAEARPAGVDRAVVQVGGGALATALVRGFASLPVFDTVQTTAAHPLERAVRRMDEDRVTAAEAAQHRSLYMWPWEDPPVSVARGILDDETYDWREPAEAMRSTGGSALVVGEDDLVEANRLARQATGIDVDETGTAGLAGLLVLARRGQVAAGSEVLVLFTGRGPGDPG